MKKTLAFIPYALSAIAGICFVGGIAILSSGLLSASLLFSGLALTAMTIKNEENEDE